MLVPLWPPNKIALNTPASGDIIIVTSITLRANTALQRTAQREEDGSSANFRGSFGLYSIRYTLFHYASLARRRTLRDVEHARCAMLIR